MGDTGRGRVALMARHATAVDPGSHTIKVLSARVGKTGVALERFGAFAASEGADGLAGLGLPLKGVVSGLAGRDMTLRYSQVPPTPDYQLKKLMELEIQDLASQSGGDLAADYNLLPAASEEGDTDTVLLALARNEVLERAEELVGGAGGSVDGHVPNCVALYNAYLKCGPVDEDQLVCLANVGHDTIDIALVQGLDLLFARNLSGGGKVLDEAIANAFNVSGRKAESLKRELLDLDPASRGRYASGQAEKVTVAAGGAASAIVSGIQSSLAFCRSQTGRSDLSLDRVLVCGGSSRLRGLRGMLREALHCPVEPLDPFSRVDLSALPPEDAEDLQTHRYEAVVALGLAVGRLDDSLYELEILPERVKRRKAFAERTVWNIAAALVLAVVLVLSARSGQSKLQEARDHQHQLSSRVAGVTRTDRATRAELARNEVRREVVDFLARRAVPLDGTVRVFRALQDTLGPELWLEGLEVTRGGRGHTPGRPQGPAVEIRGRAKELNGANSQDAYTRFRQDFARHPLVPSVAFKVGQSEQPGVVPFTCTVDFTASGTPEEGQ